MPPEILDATLRYKADLAAREALAMRQMAANWFVTMRGLEDEIAQIARTMAQRRAQGLSVTAGYLYRQERYQQLLRQSYAQFIKFEGYAADLIATNQATFARLGREYGMGLLEIAEPGITGAFNRLSLPTVENIAGMVAQGSPLRTLLADAWPNAIDQTTNALVRGVALGYSPTRIAKMMTQGMSSGLNRAMVISRTETMRAYRTSKFETWNATGIVIGYQRVATHDRRTCFLPGTMIATNDGNRPIEAVKAGDLVMTHTGMRRVSSVMKRLYTGNLVTYIQNNGETTCTPNHNIWVGRNGEYKWLEAGKLRRGDYLVTDQQVNQHLARNAWDSSSPFPTEVDNFVSLPGEKGIAPCFFGGVLMPIPSVSFKGDIIGQNKVNCVSSGGDLFLVGDTELGKSGFASQFQASVAAERTVAMRSAEVIAFDNFTRRAPKCLAAVGARHMMGRASTFFRTISASIASYSKYLTASLTGNMPCLCSSAFETAIDIPVRFRLFDLKVFPARGASLFYKFGSVGVKVALARTIPLISFGWTYKEFLRTALARLFLPFPLEYSHALSGTTPSLGIMDLGRIKRKTFVTDGASQVNHSSIISHVETRWKSNVFVYDIEVEDAHTYFANGILVHNCPACLMLDGQVVAKAQDFAEHPQGRCVPIPVTKNGGVATWKYGPEWFEGQSADTQRSILGTGRFDAWKAGAFDLRDIPVTVNSDTWGASLRARGLAELVGDASPRGVRFAVSMPPVPPVPPVAAIAEKVSAEMIDPKLLRWTAGRTDGFIDGGETYRVYHGTNSSRLESIIENGLRPPDDMKDSTRWYMVTTDIDAAKHFSVGQAGSGEPIILEFRMPSARLKEMLWSGQETSFDDVQHAIRKPLTSEFIHSATPVREIDALLQ